MDIKLPPEDSSSDLIINRKAPFEFISDSNKKLDKGAGIAAVLRLSSNTIRRVISRKMLTITKNPKI